MNPEDQKLLELKNVARRARKGEKVDFDSQEDSFLGFLLGKLPYYQPSYSFTKQLLSKLQAHQFDSVLVLRIFSVLVNIVIRRYKLAILVIIVIGSITALLIPTVLGPIKKEVVMQEAVELAGFTVPLPSVEQLQDFNYIMAIPDNVPRELEELTKIVK